MSVSSSTTAASWPRRVGTGPKHESFTAESMDPTRGIAERPCSRSCLAFGKSALHLEWMRRWSERRSSLDWRRILTWSSCSRSCGSRCRLAVSRVGRTLRARGSTKMANYGWWWVPVRIWVSSGCRSRAWRSKLAEPEGGLEGCYKARVWVIEASEKIRN